MGLLEPAARIDESREVYGGGKVNLRYRLISTTIAKEWVTRQDFSPLMQLPILRLGFLQDGDVGFGVFPEGEEVLGEGCTIYA